MGMHVAYLSLGGNLGDRMANLEETLLFIEFNMGDLIARSSVVESPAWGMPESPPFLNQVVCIRTEHSPVELMEEIRELEDFFGRKRIPGVYTSREMDVDLLLYDDLVSDDPAVEIPHPRMHLRRFVLAPLCEISPALVHPVFNQTIDRLLTDCPDTSEVKPFHAV